MFHHLDPGVPGAFEAVGDYFLGEWRCARQDMFPSQPGRETAHDVPAGVANNNALGGRVEHAPESRAVQRDPDHGTPWEARFHSTEVTARYEKCRAWR